MKQYLLSVYQPGGVGVPPQFLEKVMYRRVGTPPGDEGRRCLGVRKRPAFAEYRDRPPPERRRGAHDRRALRRIEGAPRRLHHRQRARPRRRARVGPELARATTLPIEVRPFQGEAADTAVTLVPISEIERVYREEYGRAVAVLVRVFGDIDVAEEAVQDAFTEAVGAGPLPACRRPRPAGSLPPRGTAPSTAIAARRPPGPPRAGSGPAGPRRIRRGGIPWETSPAPDFYCCHPALARGAQVALTLRLLGGLTTAEIARAFLVAEPAMAQRLVRAKGRFVMLVFCTSICN